MLPKAHRWVAEMREIAAFLGEDAAGAQVYEGIAQFYRRIAADTVDERRESTAIEAFIAGLPSES
jgi:putative dehydrogenase